MGGRGRRAAEDAGLWAADGRGFWAAGDNVRGGGRYPGGRGGTGRRLARALPVLVIIAAVIFDLVTPTRVTASPLFAAAPLFAAPFYPLAGTLAIAAASLGAEVVLHIHADTQFQVESISEVLTVLVVSLLALYINGVVRRSGERLASARIIAETAQRAVLPRPAERIGGLRIAARYEAAQEGAFIGGDLFAVQDTPYGVRLVVGDVRGKGLDAVEAVAVVIGSFREAAEQESSLEGVAQRLERALRREGTRRDGLDVFEGFTTAVLAEIPHEEGVVRLLNRGHPEPLLMCRDGQVRMLAPSDHALPLGMSELGAWPDRADQAGYPEGATLLFYTDGLTEARDAHGVFYVPRERLDGRVFQGPDEILQALIDDVRRHTGGGSQDDMALLAVSRPSEGEPERRRTMPLVP
ncbi:PP2C family protein-serine/threonine phosphatase [Streptomyces sp. 35G-GA-8]|uniref:PP2C family protein-serine/threonine phosphatase n=1 Tax=Streptomyces sp. 35G-GA-8 TaxID=2939434 RepID=UPI00201F8488|nr:PP2C family protein-serine/threonine phosphatase [Streptomyces sp. 35G-GA-8]MCL7379746.1 serine/threonine-protein phosphatase [Streptomyces sp. 35G-GA-8]